ncbi:MAG: hypothetical protein HUU35_00620 [Armatimonadetes bacterium]|nr:hypothetical protein [Armatimonadota bacterium]
MRKFALLCGVLGVLASASYADLGVDVGFDAGLYGNYVWRGQRRGPVGLIGNAYASKDIWGNFTLNGRLFNYTKLDAGKGIAEGQYEASLGWDPQITGGWLRNTQVAVGYIYYDRNNSAGDAAFQGDDTQEAFASLSWPGRLWNWSPYLAVYYDFDRGDHTAFGLVNDEVGTYLEGGVGRNWKLGDAGWSLDTAAKVGLDWGRNIDTFRDAVVHTGLRWNLEEGLDLLPSIDWWFPSNQVDPGANSFRPVGSLAVSYSRSY